MSLCEAIGEISETRIEKTEFGDSRNFGLTLGIVAQNYDKDMPGRLCVSVPVRDKDANKLQWARLVMPSGGKDWGSYFMPEIGDEVVLAFENGNIEKPFVMGCTCLENSHFLVGAVDEKNQYKQIMTKNGSTILFEDNKEGEGDKDKITLITAKKRHSIVLDNENKKIVIQDEKGKNRFEMLTEKGQIKIVSEKSLDILVSDTIKIHLNGETGAVSIKANELNVKVSKQLKMESDGGFTGKGANVKVEGTSTVKVESAGILKLDGSPVNAG